jgi:hypothetical protein
MIVTTRNRRISIAVISKPIISASINNYKQSAEVSKSIFVGTSLAEKVSTNYFFTSNDLVDNKLTKFHGFNSVVDVSVFNNVNEEIEVAVDASNPNSVTVDLGRLEVTGTWTIKIER